MKKKTICQGSQDPNGQPGQPVLEPLLEGAHHTPEHRDERVLLLSHQVASPWGHRRLPHVITAQVTTVRMLPSPSTAPGLIRFVWGRSFVCSSLICGSLSSARKPGEDQTKEHTQCHDNVGYVGDNQSSVNHRLQSTCSLFINENTLWTGARK